jgi:hypothetical protein
MAHDRRPAHRAEGAISGGRNMDMTKRNRLVARLAAEPEPQIVPIEEFFDGNDDLGSIGCNLLRHPGVAVFQDILVGLVRRPDVAAVYALIAELDPGPDSWPFADLILVAGSIPAELLAQVLTPLEPDEVGAADDFDIVPTEIIERHGSPVLAAWWD